MYVPFVLATVFPDDDGQRGSDEENRPSRSQTPPTPPVQAGQSQSPPPSPSVNRGVLNLEEFRTHTKFV